MTSSHHAAAHNNDSSANGAPTSCIPSGRPEPLKPTGSVRAGKPLVLQGSWTIGSPNISALLRRRRRRGWRQEDVAAQEDLHFTLKLPPDLRGPQIKVAGYEQSYLDVPSRFLAIEDDPVARSEGRQPSTVLRRNTDIPRRPHPERKRPVEGVAPLGGGAETDARRFLV
jgi:hypothetical protein